MTLRRRCNLALGAIASSLLIDTVQGSGIWPLGTAKATQFAACNKNTCNLGLSHAMLLLLPAESDDFDVISHKALDNKLENVEPIKKRRKVKKHKTTSEIQHTSSNKESASYHIISSNTTSSNKEITDPNKDLKEKPPGNGIGSIFSRIGKRRRKNKKKDDSNDSTNNIVKQTKHEPDIGGNPQPRKLKKKKKKRYDNMHVDKPPILTDPKEDLAKEDESIHQLYDGSSHETTEIVMASHHEETRKIKKKKKKRGTVHIPSIILNEKIVNESKRLEENPKTDDLTLGGNETVSGSHADDILKIKTKRRRRKATRPHNETKMESESTEIIESIDSDQVQDHNVNYEFHETQEETSLITKSVEVAPESKGTDNNVEQEIALKQDYASNEPQLSIADEVSDVSISLEEDSSLDEELLLKGDYMEIPGVAITQQEMASEENVFEENVFEENESDPYTSRANEAEQLDVNIESTKTGEFTDEVLKYPEETPHLQTDIIEEDGRALSEVSIDAKTLKAEIGLNIGVGRSTKYTSEEGATFHVDTPGILESEQNKVETDTETASKDSESQPKVIESPSYIDEKEPANELLMSTKREIEEEVQTIKDQNEDFDISVSEDELEDEREDELEDEHEDEREHESAHEAEFENEDVIVSVSLDESDGETRNVTAGAAQDATPLKEKSSSAEEDLSAVNLTQVPPGVLEGEASHSTMNVESVTESKTQADNFAEIQKFRDEGIKNINDVFLESIDETTESTQAIHEVLSAALSSPGSDTDESVIEYANPEELHSEVSTRESVSGISEGDFVSEKLEDRGQEKRRKRKRRVKGIEISSEIISKGENVSSSSDKSKKGEEADISITFPQQTFEKDRDSDKTQHLLRVSSETSPIDNNSSARVESDLSESQILATTRTIPKTKKKRRNAILEPYQQSDFEKDKPKAIVNDPFGVQTTKQEIQTNCEKGSISVSCVTWNLAEASPSTEDAAFLRILARGEYPSDIIFVSAQECEQIKPRRSEGQRSRELRRLCIHHLGKMYVPIAMHSLGGIQALLFVRRDTIFFQKLVKSVKLADVACGIGNTFHNKGAIGVFLTLKTTLENTSSARDEDRTKRKSKQGPSEKFTSLLFISAHMAAHVKNVDGRNSDFWRIATELQAQAPPSFIRRTSHKRAAQSENPCKLPSSVSQSQSVKQQKDIVNSFFHHIDQVFFCGDLNYRIELPREYTESLVRQAFNINCTPFQINQDDKHVNELRLHDQLMAQIASKRAFVGFREGKLNFPPTFKFDKCDMDGGQPQNYDTSNKQRVPSWTDRILFYSKAKNDIKVLSYESVALTRHTSDHRPVFGRFMCRIAKD